MKYLLDTDHLSILQHQAGRDFSNLTFPIECVIDTGFTNRLCLPSEAVNLLRLPFLYNLPVNLADKRRFMTATLSA